MFWIKKTVLSEKEFNRLTFKEQKSLILNRDADLDLREKYLGYLKEKGFNKAEFKTIGLSLIEEMRANQVFRNIQTDASRQIHQPKTTNKMSLWNKAVIGVLALLAADNVTFNFLAKLKGQNSEVEKNVSADVPKVIDKKNYEVLYAQNEITLTQLNALLENNKLTPPERLQILKILKKEYLTRMEEYVPQIRQGDKAAFKNATALAEAAIVSDPANQMKETVMIGESKKSLSNDYFEKRKEDIKDLKPEKKNKKKKNRKKSKIDETAPVDTRVPFNVKGREQNDRPSIQKQRGN